MKRARAQERTSLVSVASTVLVAILALVVIWQAGHSFVPDGPGQDAEIDSPTAVTVLRPYITTSDVNLRSGPGTSHDVLLVVPMKSEISVIGEPESGFAPVDAGGQRAWVSVDFISPEENALAETVTIPDAPPESEPTAEPTEVSIQAPEPTTMPAEIPAKDTTLVGADVSDAPTMAGTTDLVASLPPNSIIDEAVEIPEEEVDVAAGERWIEIDRTLATVTLHDGQHIIAVYDALLGKDPSPDGYYSTAVGTHYVFSMNRELTETPFAPGVYLTDWVGFDPDRSNGIHSPVRDAEGNVVVTGGTTTLGCVRLGADQARAVFDFAFIGMRVEVHD